jgi:hypothetical protein
VWLACLTNWQVSVKPILNAKERLVDARGARSQLPSIRTGTNHLTAYVFGKTSALLESIEYGVGVKTEMYPFTA